MSAPARGATAERSASPGELRGGSGAAPALAPGRRGRRAWTAGVDGRGQPRARRVSWICRTCATWERRSRAPTCRWSACARSLLAMPGWRPARPARASTCWSTNHSGCHRRRVRRGHDVRGAWRRRRDVHPPLVLARHPAPAPIDRRGDLGVPWAVHVTWLAAGGLGGGTVEPTSWSSTVAERRRRAGQFPRLSRRHHALSDWPGSRRLRPRIARSQSHTAHQKRGCRRLRGAPLGLERGVCATITVGRLADGAVRGAGRYAVRVHGSHGSAVVDEDRPLVEVRRRLTVGGRRRKRSGTLELRGLLDDFVTRSRGIAAVVRARGRARAGGRSAGRVHLGGARGAVRSRYEARRVAGSRPEGSELPLLKVDGARAGPHV